MVSKEAEDSPAFTPTVIGVFGAAILVGEGFLRIDRRLLAFSLRVTPGFFGVFLGDIDDIGWVDTLRSEVEMDRAVLSHCQTLELIPNDEEHCGSELALKF
jgi:hypothetical protein